MSSAAMIEQKYQQTLRSVNQRASEFAEKQPKTMGAFGSLRKAALSDGVLDAKTKELIALAIAVIDQCDGCIAFHVDHAVDAGATAEEIQEALSVAILMGGGPALVYATHAMEAIEANARLAESEPVPRYFD